MSDSYCKGCRDSEAGCERCLPAREERARRERLAQADQAVLDASGQLDAEWLRSCEFSRDMRIVNYARAELARRGLK